MAKKMISSKINISKIDMLIGACALTGLTGKYKRIRNSLFYRIGCREQPCKNCGGFYSNVMFCPSSIHYEGSQTKACKNAEKLLKLFLNPY